MELLRVIADDLTGACDVGAALLPWREPVLVEVRPGGGGSPAGLHVRNTRSRPLAPAAAAGRVREALADVPARWQGVLLKKIDTGLRGPLGAELDAAMDAVGADEAFVLAAIPDAGRTTVGGVQCADGVPVDRTAFARDPGNPVRDARVTAVFASTSWRKAGLVHLDDVRAGRVEAAVDRLRRDGTTVVVCDAETDDDLDRALGGLLGRARPLVLAGSTGLARALRRATGGGSAAAAAARDGGPGARGVLVVVGSLHPATRAQIEHAMAGGGVRVVIADRATDTIAQAQGVAAGLRKGDVVVLRTSGDRAGDGALGALARVARAAMDAAMPRALVLVGGETAQEVLVALGVGWLALDGAPAPLAVRAHVAAGALAGLAIVTKGGSTGPPERLRDLIEEVRR